MSGRLLDRLPAVRGTYTENADLARYTWFRVGGPAEVLFRPADRDDLVAFMRAKPADVPVTVIGVASNLLVRDGGVPGVTLRLGRPFTTIEVDGTRVRCAAAALDANVAKAARDAGLAGLEFFIGVPGTVGGALRMNAGAYGRETRDALVEAVAVDAGGGRRVMAPAEMSLGYRHCGVPDDWVFLEATFEGEPGDRDRIAVRMAEIQASREATQPIRTRTGGSTFANPVDAEGRKVHAWALIDAAGCRGLRRGAAVVSEKHCNFLVNDGGASAADLEGLGEEVRRRVLEHSGVELRWEIRRVGVAAGGRA